MPDASLKYTSPPAMAGGEGDPPVVTVNGGAQVVVPHRAARNPYGLPSTSESADRSTYHPAERGPTGGER